MRALSTNHVPRMFRCAADRALALMCAIVTSLSLPDTTRAEIGAAMAIENSGVIYFSDHTRERLWRVDEHGRLSVHVRHVRTNLIAPHYNGGVMHIDNGLIRVRQFGQTDTVIPPTMVREANMRVLAMDAAGAIVGEREDELVALVPEGVVITLAPVNEAALGPMLAVTLADDGSLYILRRNRLQRISLEDGVGVVTETAIQSSQPFEQVTGMAVLGPMQVAVSDQGRGRIVRIDEAGAVSTLAEAGFGWQPTAVATHEFDVYVLERFGPADGLPLAPTVLADLVGTPRVRRIAQDGEIMTVARISSGTTRGVAIALGLIIILMVYLVLRRRKKSPASLHAYV